MGIDAADTWDITPIRYEPDDLASLKDREAYVDRVIGSFAIPAGRFGPSPIAGMARMMAMEEAQGRFLDELIARGLQPESIVRTLFRIRVLEWLESLRISWWDRMAARCNREDWVA